MNHACDNVFARPALSLDEHRNIGSRQFCQAITDGLHRLAVPENDRFGRHLSQRLDKRIETADCHGFFYRARERLDTSIRRAKRRIALGEYLNLSYVIEGYQLTKEPAEKALVIRARSQE